MWPSEQRIVWQSECFGDSEAYLGQVVQSEWRSLNSAWLSSWCSLQSLQPLQKTRQWKCLTNLRSPHWHLKWASSTWCHWHHRPWGGEEIAEIAWFLIWHSGIDDTRTCLLQVTWSRWYSRKAKYSWVPFAEKRDLYGSSYGKPRALKAKAVSESEEEDSTSSLGDPEELS